MDPAQARDSVQLRLEAGQGQLKLKLQGMDVDPMELKQLEMDLLVHIDMADWVMAEDVVRLELEGRALDQLAEGHRVGEPWREPLKEFILTEARMRSDYRDWTTWESWGQWKQFRERIDWEEDFFSQLEQRLEEFGRQIEERYSLPDWPWSRLRTIWTVVMVFLVSALSRALAPQSTLQVGLRLSRQWFTLPLWGALGWLLILALIVLLVASLVGILVLPLLLFFLFILYYLSWAHAASALGRLVTPSSVPLSALPLLIGLILLVGLTFVPYGGFIVGVIVFVAFGAVTRQMVFPMRQKWNR